MQRRTLLAGFRRGGVHHDTVGRHRDDRHLHDHSGVAVHNANAVVDDPYADIDDSGIAVGGSCAAVDDAAPYVHDRGTAVDD